MAFVKIGKELKRLRERAGMSQRAFGEAIGASWRSVQEWEADRVGMDIRKADSIIRDAKNLPRQPKRKEKTQ